MERCFYMHMREENFVHFLPRFQYSTRADPIYDRHTCPLKLRFHATGMPPLRRARNPTFHLVFYDKSPSPNSPSFLEKVCSGSRRDRTHPSLDYLLLLLPPSVLKHSSGRSIFISISISPSYFPKNLDSIE